MRSAAAVLLVCFVAGVLGAPRGGLAQEADSGMASPGVPPAPPPARKIPGINVADPFPDACIGCHVNMPEQNLDTRFRTLLKAWNEKVEPGLLEKAQAAAPQGLELKGRHPAVQSALRDIPVACMKCHGEDSKKAPPFGRLMHRIHLVGGEENHFMTIFQGECTLCHKLDQVTGAWTIPSGPEP